jgi:hypothetical protein
MLALLVLGCDVDLFGGSAPYLLATGLGDARSFVPSDRGTVFVATPQGVLEVTPEGRAAVLLAGDARGVAASSDRLYALRKDTLVWASLADPPVIEGSRAIAGLLDLQTWCDGQVMLAYADRLTVWRPGEETETLFGSPPPGIRAVARGGTDCRTALVATSDAVLEVANAGPPRSLASVSDARAVARDALGRTWVVHGSVLSRVDGAELVEAARDLGTATDLSFGASGLVSPQNAYVLEAEGRLEYVHVADLPQH